MADQDRLSAQLGFIAEIDKVKGIIRQTWVLDGERRENDAEHSWHIALMAILLQEYAQEPIDVLHVVKMLLIHDLVEIDAGDTFAYDVAGHADKEEREQKAADRIFNLLPPDQADEVMALWREFEARETPESRYAAALDRFQPMFHNFLTNGKGWQKHGIRRDQVIARNQHIEEGAPALWKRAQVLIEEAVATGALNP